MTVVKQNLNEIIERNKAFFNREKVDSPLIGVHINGRDALEIYPYTKRNLSNKTEILPEDINIRDFIKDLKNIITMHEEIGGDLLVNIGPLRLPWMEAIIGCQIIKGGDSFYTKPGNNDWRNLKEDNSFIENNKWFLKLIEFQKALLKEFGDIYPLASTAKMRGPADMMSAFIGANRFPIELYDNPDDIKKIGSLFTKVFIDVANAQYEIVKKSKFGNTVHSFSIWTPEICQYLQDDAIAFLSPELYKEFILKEHMRIVDNFNYILYHVHPISLFVVDELIKMNHIAIIEINREPQGPSIEELLPIFKKIQDYNKNLIISLTQISVNYELFKKEIEILFSNLSYKGLCLYINADSTEDGIKRIDIVRKALEKREDNIYN